MKDEDVDRDLMNIIKLMRSRNRTAMKPSEGIWYYVYLKPHWKLFTIPFEKDKDFLHMEMWSNIVVPELIKHYKIEEFQEKEDLTNLVYSLPRGRVVHTAKDTWVLYNGNDLPKSLSRSSEEKKIISSFGLTSLLLSKKNVEFAFDEHEQMEPRQKEELQEIIGKVDY
jgi:hypothetical protein